MILHNIQNTNIAGWERWSDKKFDWGYQTEIHPGCTGNKSLFFFITRTFLSFFCFFVNKNKPRKNIISVKYKNKIMNVVVVYHVIIVAIGHGLLKKFWPLVLGCVLRTAGSSIIWNYADPLTSLELLNYYLTLAMSSGRFGILCHST